jgi:hypothetical protein
MVVCGFDSRRVLGFAWAVGMLNGSVLCLPAAFTVPV